MSERSIRRRLARTSTRRVKDSDSPQDNNSSTENKSTRSVDQSVYLGMGRAKIDTNIFSFFPRKYPKSKDGDANNKSTDREMAGYTAALARYTRGLFIVGGIGVAISAVTLYIIWRQLGEMHEGGVDTHALADAASRQARAADRQSVAIAAHIRFEFVRIKPRYEVVAEPQAPRLVGWDLNPFITNFGGTDARNVKMYWTLMTKDLDGKTPSQILINDGCPPPPKEIPKNDHIITMSPGKQMIQIAAILPLQTAELAYGNLPKLAIYAQGAVEYDDIFPDSKRHHVNWCILELPNDIQHGEFSPVNIRDESD